MRRLIAAAAFLSLSIPAMAQQIFLTPLASGLEQPVAVTHANDARLFIALQHGQILIDDGERLRAEPFLDLSAKVLCCGEQGLLGIAFHPHFHENGWFYISYVDLDGDWVLARFHANAGANVADAASQSIVLTIPHRQSLMHYSGNLAFGPDGYLYMGTGDGGGDDFLNAGRLDSLLGKLLRIDVNVEPYAIPPTNPFVGVPDARPEIWAYGFRNPWRFSFDRLTGDLWIGDVGQDLREEVDLQLASSKGGENYGWYGMEGTYCHREDTDICDATEGFTPPLFEYTHASGGCAVTGGYRYRGTASPALYGTYFYGDFCTGRLRAGVQAENGTWTARTVYLGPYLISSFGEDADGELYVVDYSGTILALETVGQDNRIRRLRSRRRGGLRGGVPPVGE
jgi:glucose/arabinose dehydrogenase